MKKTRKILFFCVACIFAAIAIFSMYTEDLDLIADTGAVSKVSGSSSSSSYTQYIADKTAAHKAKYGEASLTPQLNEAIVILGEEYDETLSKSSYVDENSGEYLADDGINLAFEKIGVSETSAYNSSETKERGGNNLVLHRGGDIVYNVEIKTAGFYTLYLNYYTYKGFSSNAERNLLINGKLPYEECSAFTFSRVWEDKTVEKVKDGKSTLYNKLYKSIKSEDELFYDKFWRADSNGNELKPQQVEINNYKTGSAFKDSMGYVTEPLEFYFEEGTQTITLSYVKEYFVIDSLEVRSVEKTQSYSEYYNALVAKHGSPYDDNKNLKLTGKSTKVEAEASGTKSSPTLYPITDRSDSKTSPFSITKSYLNSIGGTNWKVLGDWIAWEFSVPTSGYYNISMRAKQNSVRGMFSTRTVSLAEKQKDGTMSEYDVLFDELEQLQVAYDSKWKNITLGDNSGDFLFYFEAGKTYSLKLEVTLGDYAPLIARLQNAIDELSAIYRRIIAYTTTSPDVNRDYQLKEQFPDLFYGENGEDRQGQFYKVLNELTNISNEIKDISGGASDKTGVIDSVVVVLQKMLDNPRKIPERLNTYSTNVSSLGSLLNELREAPLTIDYIQVHTPDVELPKANAGFFESLWTEIVSFFASFFIDYSSISETGEGGEAETSIEVWMTLGRDQANVIRNLIDTSFTGENGYAKQHLGKNINVNLKLTGADVLLKATLAGIGPDVALNVDSSLPVNYALRNAVLDLTVFDDFWESVYAIPDGSEAYDEAYDNVYMASSLRQFSFYSITNEDIEKAKDGDAAAKAKVENYYATRAYCAANNISLEDLYNSAKYDANFLRENVHGIYALPEKQIFLMMFVRDDVMEELGLEELIELMGGYDNLTWQDMIDLVSELQAQQLQFYLPVNDLGANALNPVFISLLYQYGGELYTNDNKESGLKAEPAMQAFEFWTELYTNYSFPTSASFVNRFRTGEMPIGISYYEMYNTLSVFAPELKGKWSFHLIPGTEYVDENGNAYIDHTATASGTGAVIMKQEALTNGKINANGEAAWTFLKWWTSAETQRQFGVEMEGILGSAARHATANVKALKQLSWPANDIKMLLKQWSMVHEMPQVAGSYITGREMENAFRAVINNLYNARETLYEYALLIDNEIDRKREEFDLPLLKESE